MIIVLSFRHIRYAPWDFSMFYIIYPQKMRLRIISSPEELGNVPDILSISVWHSWKQVCNNNEVKSQHWQARLKSIWIFWPNCHPYRRSACVSKMANKQSELTWFFWFSFESWAIGNRQILSVENQFETWTLYCVLGGVGIRRNNKQRCILTIFTLLQTEAVKNIEHVTSLTFEGRIRNRTVTYDTQNKPKNGGSYFVCVCVCFFLSLWLVVFCVYLNGS